MCRVIVLLVLYRFRASDLDRADAVCGEETCVDEASFLQVPIKNLHKHIVEGQWDIVFADLPMNFGEDIAKWAAFGADATAIVFFEEALLTLNNGFSTYREEYMIPGQIPNNKTLIANVSKLLKPGRPLWGPMNPTLQDVVSINPELPGLRCPMFYTPQKYWPTDIAAEYFGPSGTKEIFGNLRNPFEMITAIFRMSHDVTKADPMFGVVRGFNITRDGQNYSNEPKTCVDPSEGVLGDINTFVKQVIPNMSMFNVPNLPVEVGCYLQPQAPFFDGIYGINHPLDMRKFPQTATDYLEQHGMDVKPGIRPNDLMHVRSCDNTWAGDFDDEAKELVIKYYKRDFELACQYFGYCDFNERICNQHIPGMCPDKLFDWDEAAGTYRRKTQ